MRKKLLLPFVILIGIGLHTPTPGYAWGAQGHRIIVEMAFSLLSPAAQQRLLNALGGYPIDNAATWMDSVRINHVPGYAYMSQWHFLDMNPNQTYDQVASTHDVVYNLERVIQAFDSSQTLAPDSLFMNLKILMHLMGDITQPLHDGYASDIGGNTILVRSATFNTSGNNLHHVWDDVIIQQGKITVATSLAYYKTLTSAQIDSVNQGTTTDWMLQARSYLKPDVYNFTLVKKGTSVLSLQYLNSNVPIVQQQLAYAAIRLAHVLESAFGK